MFVAVAKYLAAHIAATEERCRAFEEEARGMKRALRMPPRTSQDSSPYDHVSAAGAAAAWWWAEVSHEREIAMSETGRLRELHRHSKVE